MAKSKHSKLKNTQILFELLTRQVAADTIKTSTTSPALKLIHKYFKGNTMLSKELSLYETLCNQSYKTKDRASMLIVEVMKVRKKLSEQSLRKQKYELIREISAHYKLEDFLKTPLPNYKLYASIYTLLESINAPSLPERIVESKYCIVSHLTRGTKSVDVNTADPVLEEYKKQTEDVRLLAYRLLIENFNKKYQKLSQQQKNILKEYINNISNSDNLKAVLIREVTSACAEIKKLLPTIKDQITHIKLSEVLTLTDKYKEINKISENHVLSVLLYLELLKEIKLIKNGKEKIK